MGKVMFFENEMRKAQQQFNEAFGDGSTFCSAARYSVMLAICRMGMLNDEIRSAGVKQSGEAVREFVTVNKVLNNFFSLVEEVKRRKEVRGNERQDQAGAEHSG